MAIYSKLSNVRKLTNSSLNAIIDVSNLNFTDISAAMLEFLNDISYDEDTNSINNLYDINTNYLTVSNEFTVTLNGVPTWTIDSQGRAEGNSFLVEVAESKRDRHTNFPNWPDVGVPGEIIYTGIQLQKPPFGEDFIGYLDGRGWVSLTQGGNVTSNVLTLETYDVGSPPLGPPAVPGSGLVWVGPPGMSTGDPVTTQDLYFTDENSAVFTLLTAGDLLWEEGSALIDKLGTYSVIGTTDFSIIGGGNQHQMINTTYSAIIGGFDNRVQLSGGALNVFNAIIGGNSNIISGDAISSFIGGGSSNNLGDSIVGIDNVAIIGGSANQIIKSSDSAIIGGTLNNVDTASRSVILGGTGVSATSDDTVYIPNLTINEQYTFPNVDGSANYVLVTDGLGTVTWQAQTGGGGGANFAFTTVRNFVASVPLTITHSLDTEDIQVQLIDTISDELIEGEISTYTANTVDVTLTATLSNIKIVILSAGGVSPGGDSCWTCIGSPGFDIQMKIPGAVLPWGDDFNDLGEPALRWKDIYLGSTIDFLTTLDIDNDGTTIIKVSAGGAEFESDFSGSYNNRSIVDKEYVDSTAGGDRGLTYVILAGDLSQAQMDAKIAADAGEATQFLWSQSTSDSNYQTLSLSGIDEMVEIRIINNESLQTVTFNGLLDIWSSMQMGWSDEGTGNPALTTISCPDLLNSWDYVSITENSALTSISFPSLVRANDTSINYNILLDTLDFSSLQKVTNQLNFDTNAFTTITLPALETVENWLNFEDLFAVIDINLPLLEHIYGDLTEYNWNFNGLRFKDCNVLTTISAPLLETIDTFIHIERNDSLINISPLFFPNLDRVEGWIYICNNELLETIEFPALTYAGEFLSCSGEDSNPSLETINLPSLVELLGRFYYYSNVVSSMTTLNAPLLTKVGGFRISNASLMTDLHLPSLTEIYGLKYLSDPDPGESWGELNIFGNPLLENLSLPALKKCGSVNISNCDSIGVGSPKELSFPALEEVLTGVYEANPVIRIEGNDGVMVLSFPSLKLVERSITIQNNNNLTTVDLSALEETGLPDDYNQIIISSNPNLTYIDLFSLVSWPAVEQPSDERLLYLNNNKLDTAYVDSILIYFASMSPVIREVAFDISGQTPAAPPSGSLAVLDAIATLNAADWSISTD